jgi:hypothetical protein
MINLWDFSGNPAGLLFDEEGSALASDFLSHDYEIQEVPYFTQSSYNPFATGFRFKSAGSQLHNVTWLSFRRDRDFAVGLGGSYFGRETEARYDDHNLTYPEVHLSFCKSFRPNTCVGIDVTYLDLDFEFDRDLYPDYTDYRVRVAEEKIDGFRAEVGIRRQTSWQSAVSGISIGYERVNISWEYIPWWYEAYPYRDAHHIWPLTGGSSEAVWFAFQLILDSHQKLKLGADMRLHFPIEETEGGRYQKGFSFKLRTAYQISPAFHASFFFWTGDSFAEYLNPVYSYFSSLRTGGSAMELGLGFASQLHERVLVGLEYRFSDYPQPTFYTEPWNLETHSAKAGVEIELFKWFFVRGGYVGSSLNRGPNHRYAQESWLNSLTCGLGFRPESSGLVIELAYRYSPCDYRNWYGKWDVRSETRTISASVEKRF